MCPASPGRNIISQGDQPNAGEGLAGRRLYLAAAALSLGTILTTIDGAIVNVALPTIAHDLHVASAAAVPVVTVYQLMLVMLLLPFSAVGGRIGLKRMYQLGQLVFTIATILCFFANSLPFLLVVRALQAVGAAAALSVVSALIRLVYPARKLGTGLSFNTVIATVSAAVAPTAGGFILTVAPWPYVFAAAAPFGFLSLWLGRRALPDPAPLAARFNLAGAMLNMATFGLIVCGLEALVHGDSPVVSVAIVALGAAAAVALVLHERREPVPIMPVDLLSERVIALSVTGAFVSAVASMLVTLSLPFRLQQGYGFTPGEVGTVLAAMPLTMMVVTPFIGWLSDRVPAGILGVIGMALATIGLVLVAWVPEGATQIAFAWRLGLSGIGFGLYLSPNARLVIGSAPRDRAASAGALVSTTRMTGQACGATLLAALLALGFGSTAMPALVAAGLTVVAGLCSAARLRPSLREPRSDETADAQT